MKRLASVAVILGLATVGVAAMPHPANAWWRYGWGGVRIWVPPVIVAPPVVVAPPVAYYGPGPYYYAPAPYPGAYWVPAHWYRGYWVHGGWRR